MAHVLPHAHPHPTAALAAHPAYARSRHQRSRTPHPPPHRCDPPHPPPPPPPPHPPQISPWRCARTPGRSPVTFLPHPKLRPRRRSRHRQHTSHSHLARAVGFSHASGRPVRRRGLVEAINNTPRIRINSLSDATGCEVRAWTTRRLRVDLAPPPRRDTARDVRESASTVERYA
jgi:hypothetical protein